VAGLPLGQATPVTVVRDGQPVQLSVTVEEQPRDFGTTRVPAQRAPQRDRNALSLGKIGVEVSDLNADLAEQLGYKGRDKGVVITQVEAGSLAEGAGLRRGTLILKVDQTPVETAAAAREALEKASLERGVLMQVQTPQGGVNFVILRAETANR
jgi:serine protease Do